MIAWQDHEAERRQARLAREQPLRWRAMWQWLRGWYPDQYLLEEYKDVLKERVK